MSLELPGSIQSRLDLNCQGKKQGRIRRNRPIIAGVTMQGKLESQREDHH